MRVISKGDRYPINGPTREGLAVSIAVHGLEVVVCIHPESPVLNDLLSGTIQVGFLDANPFGWWFVNTEHGFASACWAMARVAATDRPVIRRVLEGLAPVETAVTMMVVVNVIDKRVLGFRMVRLLADRGRMAQTLLDHPIDIEAEVLDRWQLSYASRWSERQQIAAARELLWIETIDAGS